MAHECLFLSKPNVRFGSLADKTSPGQNPMMSAVTPIADKGGRGRIVR